MYYSPVPLLIIRADAPALIEVNGHPAGECGADSHIALPLSDSGDYYVALLPLFDREDARLYPVSLRCARAGSAAILPAVFHTASTISSRVWAGARSSLRCITKPA